MSSARIESTCPLLLLHHRCVICVLVHLPTICDRGSEISGRLGSSNKQKASSWKPLGSGPSTTSRGRYSGRPTTQNRASGSEARIGANRCMRPSVRPRSFGRDRLRWSGRAHGDGVVIQRLAWQRDTPARQEHVTTIAKSLFRTRGWFHRRGYSCAWLLTARYFAHLRARMYRSFLILFVAALCLCTHLCPPHNLAVGSSL